VETVDVLEPDISQGYFHSVDDLFFSQLKDLSSCWFLHVFNVLKPNCRPVDK
jgi:hypothetical protein